MESQCDIGLPVSSAFNQEILFPSLFKPLASLVAATEVYISLPSSDKSSP